MDFLSQVGVFKWGFVCFRRRNKTCYIYLLLFPWIVNCRPWCARFMVNNELFIATIENTLFVAISIWVIVNKLYRKKADHLPTTYRPLTDHLPTTYQPLTDHVFMVQLVHDYLVYVNVYNNEL